MYKKLHRQLTFFSTLITGLILCILSLLCFLITAGSLNQREKLTFQSTLDSVYTYLEYQEVLTLQWVRQIEAIHHISLFIYDGGSPLLSQDFHQSPQLFQLKEQALDEARTTYGMDLLLPTSDKLTVHQEFTLKDASGDEWQISAARIPNARGQLGVLILHSLRPARGQLLWLALLFCMADILAMLLLWMFSRRFTRRMLRPMEDSARSQHLFIASASHELRSPLSVILSAASALEHAPREKVPHFTAMIRKEGSRMSHLITDMLTLANSDARSLQLHFQPEQLDEILLDTYEKYETLAKKQKISLSLQLPQELLPDCSCDRERMEQVLTILMDNALSYVPEGGRITLALEQKNTSLEIRVIDNGPGIPREEQEKIFERFYRREASRTSRHHYGLGLCIAREILRCHHGSIHAEDTSGGGATFVVQLPLPKALPS